MLSNDLEAYQFGYGDRTTIPISMGNPLWTWNPICRIDYGALCTAIALGRLSQVFLIWEGNTPNMTFGIYLLEDYCLNRSHENEFVFLS